jgi:HD-GYP domain-containing protein (c-di-GMP phosphodiesterase class II)
MTSNRAYRAAKSWDEALEELRRGSGSQWNPKVVEAAVAVMQQERIGAPVGLTPATAGA